MDNLEPNTNYVSGPVNVVRLEGKVNKIQKVIYLFMDYHQPLFQQRECTNVFSRRIQQYLADNFYNLKNQPKKYDFFMEIRPTEIIGPAYNDNRNYQEIYIQEVVQLFRKIFDYDSKKNKVLLSDVFQNLRLHYLDVRDYLKFHIMDQMFRADHLGHILFQQEFYSANDINKFIWYMNQIINGIDSVITLFRQKDRRRNRTKIIQQFKATGKIDENTIRYLASKIKNQYHYPHVQKILNSYLDGVIDELENLATEIESNMNNLEKISQNAEMRPDQLVRRDRSVIKYDYQPSIVDTRDAILYIANMATYVLDKSLKEFALMTDIYFLRRFLDKDYVTNGIVYSGIAHSENYIGILVRDFGFEITHVSYSKINNMAKLTKKIRSINTEDIAEYLNPPVFDQCSDMTDFPENFT